MKKTSVWKGLLGIFGIYATMALIPLAELLPFSSYQLLFLRGISGVVIIAGVFLLLRQPLPLPNKGTVILSISFCVAALALFEAIKAWGANLSAVLLDMAVIVPFLFALTQKQKIRTIDVVSFGVAIFGSFIALRGWDTTLSLVGLSWSLVAMVANGFFIQYAGTSNQESNVKAFYQSLSLVVVGIAFWGNTPTLQGNLGQMIAIAVLFSVAVGYLNFQSAFLAFGNMPQIVVGVLVLGVTPSIILGSYIILGKSVGIDQLFGVLIIIVALGYRQITLAKI